METRRVLIIGNGPNLDINELESLSLLKNDKGEKLYITIGCNYLISKSKSKLNPGGFIPDYLCVSDKIFFKDPLGKNSVKKAKFIITASGNKEFINPKYNHKCHFINLIKEKEYIEQKRIAKEKKTF